MIRHLARPRPGFSMIELLVLLALLGFLLALLLPAVQKVREAAARAQTHNGLRQMSLGTINCADTYRGALPPAFGKYVNKNDPAFSLHVHILPFVEQQNLYQLFLKGQPGVEDELVRTYLSPADPSFEEALKGIQNYAANLRVFSDKGYKTQVDAPMPALGGEEPSRTRYPASITDGTSNTIFFATRYARCGEGGSRFAAKPNTNVAAFFGQNPAKKTATPTGVAGTFLLRPTPKECSPTPLMAHAFGASGVDVALGDGSSRHVAAGISVATWNAAMSPNAGDILGGDW